MSARVGSCVAVLNGQSEFIFRICGILPSLLESLIENCNLQRLWRHRIGTRRLASALRFAFELHRQKLKIEALFLTIVLIPTGATTFRRREGSFTHSAFPLTAGVALM